MGGLCSLVLFDWMLQTEMLIYRNCYIIIYPGNSKIGVLLLMVIFSTTPSRLTQI